MDRKRQKDRSSRWIEEGRGLSLVRYILENFNDFKESRYPIEDEWEECWYNYVGKYVSARNWRSGEGKRTDEVTRSRLFINLTHLKSHTAHAKIVDTVLQGGRVPFEITPFLPKEIQQQMADADGLVGGLKERIKEIFREVHFSDTLDSAALDLPIFGMGVLKGPITDVISRPVAKPRLIAGMPANEINPDLSPYVVELQSEMVPTVDHMPVWEYHTDFGARRPGDKLGEIHFQRMLRGDLRMLAANPSFDREAVFEAARRASTTSEDADYENHRQNMLADRYTGEKGEKDTRTGVLEWWGKTPVDYLVDAGVEIPAGVSENDFVEAVAVVAADGLLLKASVNPLKSRPFHVCPWKKRPHSVAGTGVAWAMRDSQSMINSAARLIVDNKAISGNLMVAVNPSMIDQKRTKDLRVYPGKVWYLKQGVDPTSAVHPITFPDITRGLRELMETFERFADEETGIPKYTHAGTQSNFLNKTARGMAMLMRQQDLNLKPVMKNIDNFWIEPVVRGVSEWLQAFEPGRLLPFPVTVHATGTESLVSKEIELENLDSFLMRTSDPRDAIYANRDRAFRKYARLLGQEDLAPTPEELQIIKQQLAETANRPRDIRELVHFDKLFEHLTPSEQANALEQMGITPDIEARKAMSQPAGADDSLMPGPPESAPAGPPPAGVNG